MSNDLPPAADRDALLVALVLTNERTRAMLEEVDIVTATPVSITYRLAPEWFQGIEAALDVLEDYVTVSSRDVLLLCERLAARLEQADVDDSGGGMVEAFKRLEALHARACALQRLPRAVLADRLRRMTYASDMEAFADWRVTHAEALGF